MMKVSIDAAALRLPSVRNMTVRPGGSSPDSESRSREPREILGPANHVGPATEMRTVATRSSGTSPATGLDGGAFLEIVDRYLLPSPHRNAVGDLPGLPAAARSSSWSLKPEEVGSVLYGFKDKHKARTPRYVRLHGSRGFTCV